MVYSSSNLLWIKIAKLYSELDCNDSSNIRHINDVYNFPRDGGWILLKSIQLRN